MMAVTTQNGQIFRASGADDGDFWFRRVILVSGSVVFRHTPQTSEGPVECFVMLSALNMYVPFLWRAVSKMHVVFVSVPSVWSWYWWW
jgi:hypothetical protein